MSTLSTSWRMLDQLVEVHVMSRMLARPIPGIVDEISRVRSEIIRSPHSMNDFNSLADSELLLADNLQHKVAWIAGRVTGHRSWVASAKVVHERQDGLYSPLLEQIALLGFDVDRSQCEPIVSRWRKKKTKAVERIDGATIDEASKTITLCKGVSRANVSGREGYAPLFVPDDVIIADASVCPKQVNCLLRAGELVDACVRGWQVRLLLFVVAPDYSWVFQAHDMSSCITGSEYLSEVQLDDYSVYASTKQYIDDLRDNPDLFSTVGNPPPFKSLVDALAISPVSRYTRCVTLLLELWHRQRAMDELLITPSVDFESWLREKYRIFITNDLRRHDSEDCLRAGRFIRRVPWRKNAYGLDYRGVARILTLFHKYNPMTPITTEATLDFAFEQLLRWNDGRGRNAI